MLFEGFKTYNKMSSQLSLLTTFNFEDFNVLVGKNNQPWFKQAIAGRYLGIVLIIKLTTK